MILRCLLISGLSVEDPIAIGCDRACQSRGGGHGATADDSSNAAWFISYFYKIDGVAGFFCQRQDCSPIPNDLTHGDKTGIRHPNSPPSVAIGLPKAKQAPLQPCAALALAVEQGEGLKSFTN